MNFTCAPAGVFWKAAISFTYAGCGVEYATKFSVTSPLLAAEPLAAGEAGADDAAVDGAAADEEAVEADGAAAEVPGLEADGDAADFLELLQPAAKTRPDAATITTSLFSGRTLVLQVV